MSKMKAVIPVLFLAAVLFLIPGTKLNANAAGATYVVAYDSAKGQWMYEPGSQWKDSDYHREMYYLKQVIQNGDLLVITGKGSQNLILELSVSLSNLTVLGGNPVVVYATDITDCYVTEGAVASVNAGTIQRAYVYNGGTANFNATVKDLEIKAGGTQSLYSNASASGVVEYVRGSNDYQTHWEFYNVTAGKLSVVNGVWKTDAQYYSRTPSAKPAAATQTSTSTAVNTSTDISLVFDPIFYANRYPDLKAAGITTDAQLKSHFLTNGMKEGRQGHAQFDVHAYKDRYTDLQKIYGEDLTQYYYHFINNGYREGRKATR
ncbi:MAG: hypothetical protein K6A92_00280 [Lachnospiraceae bacterium]|nr:hypothetical protein [Lachnospiraceae bacterium]